MNFTSILQNHFSYPADLKSFQGGMAPEYIFAIGNYGIITAEKTAIFCSSKCPGNAILKAYDLACSFRDSGITVISGFHSSIEKECFDLLLRGKQSIIIAIGRSLEGMRIPREWRKPIEDGRLLLISPFSKRPNRLTKNSSEFRNRFVAAIADRIVIIYAHPGSKTEKICYEALSWRKPVFALDVPENTHLFESGILPISETIQFMRT